MERRNSVRTLAERPCVGAVALVVSTVIGVDPAAAQAYPSTAAPAGGARTSVTQEKSSAGASRATDGGLLEEIIVTATRHQASAQNVPLALTAVTENTLRAAGVPSVRELTYLVPGFAGGRNFGAFQPTIRGVGSTGVTASDEPSVAAYVAIAQDRPRTASPSNDELGRVGVDLRPVRTPLRRTAEGLQTRSGEGSEPPMAEHHAR